MKNLADLLDKHIICHTQKELRKHFILKTFQSWIKEENFNEWCFSLFRFSTIRPLKYFNPEIIDETLDFYNNNPNNTLKTLVELQNELTHAIFSLLREGMSWGKEKRLTLNNAKDIIDFEQIWHPEYQRYCEHIFNHLIRVILGVLGKIKQKDYQSLTLQNRSNILKDNGFSNLVRGFNPTIRNAISHGNVEFRMWEIEYNDHKNNEKLFPYEFAKLFDDLVENCHSILIALFLFIIKHKIEVEKIGLEELTLGIRFFFIDGICSHIGFQISGLVESYTKDNEKQLNIACKIKSLNRAVQIFEILNLARTIIIFGGNNYSRFSFLIDCGKLIQPALFLNAKKLNKAIINNEELSTCLSGIFEANLLWFDSSNWLRKIYFYKNNLILTLKLLKLVLYKEWRNKGLNVITSRYYIKHIENKSTNKMRRVDAYICLKESGEYKEDLIYKILRHAVKKIRKQKVKKIDFKGDGWIARKPDYVWLRVYLKDRTLRSLMASGWESKYLILRAEWFSIWKNNGPIFIKNPYRIYKRIRIEYDPELIKNLVKDK